MKYYIFIFVLVLTLGFGMLSLAEAASYTLTTVVSDPSPPPVIPDYYLDGDTGSDAADGTSWETAKLTYSGVEALVSTGDNIYMRDTTEAIIDDVWVNDVNHFTEDVNQWGIHWQLNKLYRTHQYINGDIWVYDSDGTVVVSSVSPARGLGLVRTSDTINGSQLAINTNKQAFHSGTTTAPYDGSYAVSFPVTITGPNSLISSNCYDLADADLPANLWGYEASVNSNQPKIETTAVLTIVDYIPTVTELRPSYAATDNHRYDWADVNLANLTEINPTSFGIDINDCWERNSGTYTTAAEAYIRYFRRPWLLWSDGVGRDYHPAFSQPSYHSDVSTCISEGALLLTLALDDLCAAGELEDLAILYAQLGVDMNGICTQRRSDAAKSRYPTMFLGYILDDANTISAPQSWAEAAWPDRADGGIDRPGMQVFYWNHGTRFDDQSDANSGQFYPFSNGDTLYNVGWAQDSRPEDEFYGYSEAEVAWQMANNGLLKDWGDVYQHINSKPYIGIALATQLSDLVTEWEQPAYFQYCHLWFYDMNEISYRPASYGQSTSSFVTDMMYQYWSTPSTTVVDTIPDYDPNVEWKFDGRTGVQYDTSGEDNTLINVPWTRSPDDDAPEGTRSYAFSAGSNQYAYILDANWAGPLKSGTADINMTIVGWFNHGTGPVDTYDIITKTDGRSSDCSFRFGAQIYEGSHFYRFGQRNAAGTDIDWADFGTSLELGVWYYVGIVYDANGGVGGNANAKMYVWDNEAKAYLGTDVDHNFDAGVHLNTEPVTLANVGGYDASREFNGKMDGIRFWKRCLSKAEIEAVRQYVAFP